MIVDDAESDIEMVKDPFLEAGIDIPEELPYQESRKSTFKMRFSKKSEKGNNDRISVTDSIPCDTKFLENFIMHWYISPQPMLLKRSIII